MRPRKWFQAEHGSNMLSDLVDASISFEPTGFLNDYIINDKPLRKIIFNNIEVVAQNEFGVAVGDDFSTAVDSQPGTLSRFLGETQHDLVHGLTALYLCGHCGGYDGTLIGAHVNVYRDFIVWSNIGYSSDTIELYPKHKPFGHIPSFSFKRSDYEKFIEAAREYEIK